MDQNKQFSSQHDVFTTNAEVQETVKLILMELINNIDRGKHETHPTALMPVTASDSNGYNEDSNDINFLPDYSPPESENSNALTSKPNNKTPTNNVYLVTQSDDQIKNCEELMPADWKIPFKTGSQTKIPSQEACSNPTKVFTGKINQIKIPDLDGCSNIDKVSIFHPNFTDVKNSLSVHHVESDTVESTEGKIQVGERLTVEYEVENLVHSMLEQVAASVTPQFQNLKVIGTSNEEARLSVNTQPFQQQSNNTIQFCQSELSQDMNVHAYQITPSRNEALNIPTEIQSVSSQQMNPDGMNTPLDCLHAPVKDCCDQVNSTILSSSHSESSIQCDSPTHQGEKNVTFESSENRLEDSHIPICSSPERPNSVGGKEDDSEKCVDPDRRSDYSGSQIDLTDGTANGTQSSPDNIQTENGSTIQVIQHECEAEPLNDFKAINISVRADEKTRDKSDIDLMSTSGDDCHENLEVDLDKNNEDAEDKMDAESSQLSGMEEMSLEKYTQFYEMSTELTGIQSQLLWSLISHSNQTHHFDQDTIKTLLDKIHSILTLYSTHYNEGCLCLGEDLIINLLGLVSSLSRDCMMIDEINWIPLIIKCLSSFTNQKMIGLVLICLHNLSLTETGYNIIMSSDEYLNVLNNTVDNVDEQYVEIIHRLTELFPPNKKRKVSSITEQEP